MGMIEGMICKYLEEFINFEIKGNIRVIDGCNKGYLCSINQQVFLNIGLFLYYCMKVRNKNKTFLSVVKLMEYKRIGTINFKDSINTRVFVQFLAQDVSVGTQKDRISRFISLRMVDKDISVEAKMFGVDNNTIELVKDGKVYNAAVDVKPYDKSQFGYSCIIYNIDTSDDSPESFLDWADNLGECQKIIENILPIIINTYYAKILVDSLLFKERIENISKITKEDIVELSKKININTLFLLEGETNENN